MTAAVISMLLLQACGQNQASKGGGESFAAVELGTNPLELNEGVQSATGTQGPAVPAISPEPSPAVESSPAVEAAALPSPEPAAEPSITPGTSKPSAPPAAAVPKETFKETFKKAAGSSKTAESPAPEMQPADGTSGGNKSPGKGGTTSPSPQTGPIPGASPPRTEATLPGAESSSTGNTAIDWNGFFDGSDQTRPSEQFWDLSGSKVTIKGFMGEVLSFEKNWFLLIPEPGAECPFDNGDETYWNKIMIVFVPEGSKLRHTSGPLEISGRLDVGIKIDESGYKTMFRLYDASFKSM